MGYLTKSQIDSEIAAGRVVIMRNGDSFTLVKTAADSPASDQAVIDGATTILVGGSDNVLQDIAWSEGSDVALGTTTGSKIGTGVTQKLGFWNKTPVIQQAHANQAALIDSTGGTASGTFTLVDCTASYSEAAVEANFATIAVLVNQLRTALVNTGIVKGAG